jgi:ATP-dependent RNA helicase RhlB
MTAEHTTDTTFHSLDLHESLLKGLDEIGFTHCTPIQAEALPLALAGQDVAGQAQTGTGKSAAFLLAMFNYLLLNPASEDRKPTQPRAIIMAPTRELAIQIHKDALSLGKYADFKMALVYGGTGYEQQRKQLEDGVDILIGTPGRTIDYYKQRIFDLKAIQVMIMDEADRMFDLGFINDIRYLLNGMPPREERLNLMFSATLSHRVSELAYDHMDEPQRVEVASDQKTADRVSQVLYHTANEEKIPLLIGLLRHMDPHRTLVFINTKHMAEKIQSWLETNGLHAEVISGDVPQNKRQRLLEDFSSGALPILVATDVAARGLHIPDVSHVFNFDLPQDAEDYVHRIGRTARAGASGDAISFACETHAYSLMDIEEYIGNKIPVERITADLLPEDLVKPKYRERKPRDRDSRGRSGGDNRGRGRPDKRSSASKQAPRSQAAKTGPTENTSQAPKESAPQPAAPAKAETKPAAPVAAPRPRRSFKGGGGPAVG